MNVINDIRSGLSPQNLQVAYKWYKVLEMLPLKTGGRIVKRG
jgi:hypothetical protein